MIKLNLLPEKVRAAERLRLILLLGAAVYVLFLLGLALRWNSARAKVAAVELEVEAVNRALNAPELQQTVREVERFTKDKGEVSAKGSQVNELRKKQATLVRLLDALPDWTLDGQVWFIKVTVTEDKGAKQVVLDGAAVSRLAFARFYTNLESQPLVKKLVLDGAGVRVAAERGLPIIGFKVTFTLEEYR